MVRHVGIPLVAAAEGVPGEPDAGDQSAVAWIAELPPEREEHSVTALFDHFERHDAHVIHAQAVGHAEELEARLPEEREAAFAQFHAVVPVAEDHAFVEFRQDGYAVPDLAGVEHVVVKDRRHAEFQHLFGVKERRVAPEFFDAVHFAPRADAVRLVVEFVHRDIEILGLEELDLLSDRHQLDFPTEFAHVARRRGPAGPLGIFGDLLFVARMGVQPLVVGDDLQERDDLDVVAFRRRLDRLDVLDRVGVRAVGERVVLIGEFLAEFEHHVVVLQGAGGVDLAQYLGQTPLETHVPQV